MDTKKVLISGGSDSVYIKEYVENMLKYDPSIQFTIATNSKKRYRDFYKKKKVRLIQIGYNDFNGNFSDLDKVSSMIAVLLRGKFDFIHVHGVAYHSLKLATMIAGNKSKLVLSVWGFLSQPVEIRSIEPLLKNVYKINFLTETLKQDFQKNYGHKYDEKSSVFDLGLNCISTMARMMRKSTSSQLKRVAKEELGFPADKIAVAIGYCGRRDQQHLLVLKELEKLPESVLNRLYVYVHVSYGVMEPTYITQIEKKLKRLDQYGCQYNLSTEYMIGERLAYLRFGIDMFINAEITDAMSGSMLEYMFGGALVLNPAWLDYSELTAVKYVQYEKFSDLSFKIEENIDELEIIKSNRKAIWNRNSWKRLLPKWGSLYE